MRGFNYKKAIQLLNYIAQYDGGVTNKMKALKLIWLSDRLHLQNYGRTITGDTYYALPNGPVASGSRDVLEESNFINDSALDYAKNYITIIDKYDYKSISEVDYKVFSQTENIVFTQISEQFSQFDHFELSKFSHKFPEWKKHESALIQKLSSRFVIDEKDLFINHKEKSGLFHQADDELSLAKSIFELNKQSSPF